MKQQMYAAAAFFIIASHVTSVLAANAAPSVAPSASSAVSEKAALAETVKKMEGVAKSLSEESAKILEDQAKVDVDKKLLIDGQKKLAEDQKKLDDEKAAHQAEVEKGKSGQADYLSHFSVAAGSMKLPRAEVKKASVVNGVVVVNESVNHRNSFWLQSNLSLTRIPVPWCDKAPFSFKGRFAPGLWVGLEMNPDKSLINSVALGVQLSILTPEKDAKGAEISKNSLNIGYGRYRSTIQSLADGIVAGQKLPDGVNEITYKSTSITGAMFMVSYGFSF